jgi:nucleoside 2-deoxyribosyltransferase
MTIKIYVAGPEVFLPDARAVLARKAGMVRQAGFLPLCPGDLEIPPHPVKKEFGKAISAADETMMVEADAIIANLTPFRGITADTGTAYELGFMCALGKIVLAYTNVPGDHYDRIVAHYGGNIIIGADGHRRGPDGLSAEDFDMVDNLMLQGGVERRGGVVVVGHAPPDNLIGDVTAFAECLEILKSRNV